MIKKLLIVFASGFALSIVALSAAWVIGGQDLMTRIQRDHHFSIDVDDDDRDAGTPQATRSLTFDGARLLTVSVPVEMRFVRGEKTEMTVSGPAAAINALVWENDELSLRGKDQDTEHRSLRLTITAPQFAGLILNAPGDIELRDLDQSSLKLEVRSPASVDARGRVDTLDVSTSGVGSLDLARLDARDAKAEISGVGSIDLNARGKVDVAITGAGSVSLHRKPAVLTSRTNGLGSIDNDY
ncbi:DUF2807 domain-containing protein [Novosphingobium sp. JCM 18896]|uniref:DUF2807 domain-containing protein n=1 Tax=Novosphingobium sp. JCM 18896 TaxID=2989731 RepID=UPI002221E17E|nr:DUF2807 domain-containing protein [Novosphingobium sp. JCM 18896]MCW1429241.1 DUF2807 domain-containing protein [Novosphingobium sp. JCM 18896]